MASACQHDDNPGLCVAFVSMSSKTVAMPQQSINNYDRALETLRIVGSLAIPAWQMDRMGRYNRDTTGLIVDGFVDVAGFMSSMERPDNSITIGGDQIGRDRIDDRSRHGWTTHDGITVRDSCIGDSCRSQSDGPWDNSDRSDRSDRSDNRWWDNSNTIPPPPEPE